MARKRSGFASTSEVRRIARLAKEFGIEIAALRVGSDGAVTVFDARLAALRSTESEADAAVSAWEKGRDGGEQA
jgi:hypothetical protein